MDTVSWGKAAYRDSLARRLQDAFLVPFEVDFVSGKQGICITGKPESKSLGSVKVSATLINTTCLLVKTEPEPFSQPLINTMADSDVDERKKCQASLTKLKSITKDLVFNANDCDLVHKPCEDWPRSWTSFKYKFTVCPFDQYNDEDDLYKEMGTWIVRAFRPIFDLLEITIEGAEEGNRQRALANEYERDSRNRELCIAANGCTCAICGFNFEEAYGPLGRGFIHVHHVVPVSQIGPSYQIDPVHDLIPVCPNCHAMLHQADPPLKPSQLKSIIKAQGKHLSD